MSPEMEALRAAIALWWFRWQGVVMPVFMVLILLATISRPKGKQ